MAIIRIKRMIQLVMVCVAAIVIVLIVIQIRKPKSSLCEKNPRSPPPGCCPEKYHSICCPFAGDNETIVPCEKERTLPNKININIDLETACVHEWLTSACADGFYFDIKAKAPRACPPGFFCPPNLLCIIPCPSGAYCIQQEKVLETKDSECLGFGVCCGNNESAKAPLVLKSYRNRKCKGLRDKNCLCGGSSIPELCPAGYYCPTTHEKSPCPSGYYCRSGSTSPHLCTWLTKCKSKSSAPIINIPVLFGVILSFIILTLICLYQKSSTVVSQLWKLGWWKFIAKQNSSNETSSLRNPLLPYTDPDSDTMVITPVNHTINIRFENLGFEIANNVRLEDVTGRICSGELTAVMGHSGSGKTTFLNVLSGKAYYGVKTGKIFFNDHETEGIEKFRSVTGFVPQEDTMHRNLTVYEVLYYQAMLRLPTTASKNVEDKIGRLLKLLKIANVSNSKIGDEETERGISGGQRKRVNIGMELIAEPTLLFLDEPTSGLDSTSSKDVMDVLKVIAEKKKMTVLCVIHQPRFEIFNLFDKIILFGSGGRMVFQGTVPEADEYFSSLGFKKPPEVNAADFYMDIIKKPLIEENEYDTLETKSDYLVLEGECKKFNHYQESTVLKVNLPRSWKTKQGTSQGRISRREDASGASSQGHSSRIDVFPGRPKLPSTFHQFFTFTRREFVLLWRLLFPTIYIQVLVVLFAGAVLGALYFEVQLEKFTGLTRMSGMAIGLTTTFASLKCFGLYRTTFWRESAAGVNRLSYFLAVNFAQLPILLLMPLVYLSLLYTFSSPRSYFSVHYIAVFCAQLCCSGLGYAISTFFSPKDTQMVTVLVILVMTAFSGFSPTLCKLDDLPFVGTLGYTLSYNRWFVEALFEKEALRYPDVVRPIRDAIAFPDHYSLDGNYSFCLGVIVIMAIVFRLIAFFFLLVKNKGKQQ